MLQAKKQQLLNEVWRKVAEYNYPDFVHVVVPPVIEACDPPNYEVCKITRFDFAIEEFSTISLDKRMNQGEVKVWHCWMGAFVF